MERSPFPAASSKKFKSHMKLLFFSFRSSPACLDWNQTELAVSLEEDARDDVDFHLQIGEA
ncbi:hypothetical protein OUZ56_026800 [Daphnia magna]|uniref:Uncharacterized protein n=1 Tax=Daphnia magna TaxID=35525 RepID=A0ABQ9ZMY4_9CRUS|nr:hypothetical protein OUZ56_026800 [Daphnia magna]